MLLKANQDEICTQVDPHLHVEPLLRIGSPAEIQEMFEVAVQHGVKPWVTTYPMDKAGEAVTAMHEGKARYRFVLVPK